MSGSSHSQDQDRNRWNILVGIVVSILLLSGCASETPKVYRVGILVGSDTLNTSVDSFKAKMTELGYAEEKDIVYDVQLNYDLAEEQRIADKFVADKVDLVFAFPGPAARIVKAAAQGTDIPIVFANAVIEGTGLVDSVRSPGGNITGVRVPGTELTLKRFESLLEFTPRFEQIMVIYEANYTATLPAREALRSAALSSNVTLQEVPVTRIADVQAILQGLEKSGDTNMDAILFLLDTLPQSSEASDLIFKFADAHRVPVAGGPATLVRNGKAVLCVTTESAENGELAASLADEILKGTLAGTIPVVSPQPRLYINYTKAQELGLTVPEGLLKQATEIIR